MTGQTLTNRRDTRPPTFALHSTAGVRKYRPRVSANVGLNGIRNDHREIRRSVVGI
jgi:hypothetical protein